MGAASESRYRKFAMEQSSANDRPSEFLFMDRMNAIEKLPDIVGSGAARDYVIAQGNGGEWWILDPVKREAGFGYYYQSLSGLMRNWDIYLHSFDGRYWHARSYERTQTELVDSWVARIESRWLAAQKAQDSGTEDSAE